MSLIYSNNHLSLNASILIILTVYYKETEHPQSSSCKVNLALLVLFRFGMIKDLLAGTIRWSQPFGNFPSTLSVSLARGLDLGACPDNTGQINPATMQTTAKVLSSQGQNSAHLESCMKLTHIRLHQPRAQVWLTSRANQQRSPTTVCSWLPFWPPPLGNVLGLS